MSSKNGFYWIVNADNLYPYERLMLGIIAQAAKEVLDKKMECCEPDAWLLGQECKGYCEWLDIDHERIIPPIVKQSYPKKARYYLC